MQIGGLRLGLVLISGIVAAALSEANPTVTNIQLVSQQSVNGSMVEATYRVEIRGSGGGFTAITATVASTNAATTIIDGSLTFPDVAPGATVTSSDTLAIRHDLRTPFQNSFLKFHISARPIGGNGTPIANAGPDQTVGLGYTVTLNGSRASDPDGDALTFQWTLTSSPAGSTAALIDPTSVSPTFVADTQGTYAVSLVVNDGSTNSAADTVLISTSNSAPLANAGPDLSSFTGSTVTLDGSGSSDVDGDPLAFSWTVLSRPDGSSASLSSPAAVMPGLTIDVFGTYVVQLVVNDGRLNSAPETVTINTANSPPAADAGPNQTAPVGRTVVLDGSGSTDIDGQALTFRWSITSAPSGSTTAFSSPSEVAPTIAIDRPGTYVLQLIVNDGFVNSKPDTITVTTLNSVPVANAGADQRVDAGSAVSLNGSASSDVDGNPLSFSWALTSRPSGSSAALSDPAAVMPTFVADSDGQYVVQLIVNDGTANSKPDTMVINTGNTPPTAKAVAHQAVAVGSLVTPNGSGSTDVDGDELTFAWSFVSRPEASAAEFSNPAAVMPAFKADVAGDYVVQLIVNDGTVNSPPRTVRISTTNRAPEAKAGLDQTVRVGAAVQVNGSASSDPEGAPITSRWSLIKRPAASAAILSNANSATPTFTPDVDGTYVAQLIVNDGSVDSSPDTVTIDTSRVPPVANAGPDQSFAVGSTVALDGSRSWDADGKPLSYTWSFTSRPAGSAATLVNPTGASPSFVADMPGMYVAQLIVNDGTARSSPVTVVATTQNRAPTANAGDDSSVEVGEAVKLDGTASADPDGDPTTSAWSIVSAPEGSTAALTNANSTTPSLTPDVEGTYVVELVVKDGTLDSPPDAVTITVAAADTGTLVNGLLRTGAISTTAEVDTYTFTASAGDRMAIHIGEIADNNDFRPWIRLQAPGGAVLGNTWGLAAAAIGDVVAPATGTYSVLVASNDSGLDGTGTYRITMTRTPGPIATASNDQGGPLTNGGVHTGEIVRGDVDVWTFTANVGDRIAVQVAELTDIDDFRPWIRIWAPNGTSLASTWNLAAAAIDSVVAPVAGRYLVLVASNDTGLDGRGTYRLNMVKTPAPVTVSEGDDGGPLTNGGIHNGEIVPGDLDVWTFSAAAGDRIAVQVGELTETSDFRPWIRIWAPNGAQLASTWNLAAAAIDSVVAPITGRYLILVASNDTGSDGAGTYQLNMVKTPAPVTISAGDQGGPLTNGGVHTGEITRGDLDVWTFAAKAGDRIAVQVGELTETSDFRPWIRIWAPNGTQLASTWNLAAAAIDSVVAPMEGRYLLLVASNDAGSDGAGTYRLNLVKTPVPVTVSEGDEGGPMSNGGEHTGAIVPGDLDVWTFAATAGDRIAVQIGELSETNDFRPWIRIWAPNGAQLASTWNIAAAAIDSVVAPMTGRYLIVVASNDAGSDGAGTYRLNLVKTPVPVTVSAGDQGGPITNGGLHPGAIVPGDLDVWTFAASPGDRIAVQIAEVNETDDFRPWIRIWAPNGAQLASTWNVNAAAIDSVVAPVAGRYLIVVASNDAGSNGAGTYRINMVKTPAPVTVLAIDQGGPLTNGAAHNGTIIRADLDVWTIPASVGDRISVQITELTDNNDFRPWIRVWAPNGTQLGSTWGVAGAALNNLNAPIAGTYLIVVGSNDAGSDGTGTYQLTVNVQ